MDPYRVIKRRKWDDSVKAGAELLRSMLIYPDEGISHRCCNILEPAWCVCVCETNLQLWIRAGASRCR